MYSAETQEDTPLWYFERGNWYFSENPEMSKFDLLLQNCSLVWRGQESEEEKEALALNSSSFHSLFFVFLCSELWGGDPEWSHTCALITPQSLSPYTEKNAVATQCFSAQLVSEHLWKMWVIWEKVVIVGSHMAAANEMWISAFWVVEMCPCRVPFWFFHLLNEHLIFCFVQEFFNCLFSFICRKRE